MESLSMIKSRYYTMAHQLGAFSADVPFATTPQHDGSPHIEHVGWNYCYVITERGSEYERRQTGDPNELLYWLISDLTLRIAIKFELDHRVPRQDTRRLWIKKHLELLAKVNNDWSQRKQAEYDQILAEHPFCDEKVQT